MKTMKHIFTLIAVLIGGCFTASANEQDSGQVDNMSIKEFVETLNDVKGYFFIGKNECRDLSLTIARDTTNSYSQPNEVRAFDWSTLNPNIATVTDNGLLDGVRFGETIITSTNGNEVDRYIVFVCPRITIVSPEGAIYTYHKVYNQKTRIQFTQSEDYVINCAIRDGVDITDEIDKATGWYESDQQITDDTLFWVTMEKASPNKGRQAETVVGSSHVKVTVDGQEVTIEGPQGVLSKPVTVTDVWGHTLFNGTWPSDDSSKSKGSLVFNRENKGIFFIEIPDYNTYKIIIHDFIDEV